MSCPENKRTGWPPVSHVSDLATKTFSGIFAFHKLNITRCTEMHNKPLSEISGSETILDF